MGQPQTSLAPDTGVNRVVDVASELGAVTRVERLAHVSRNEVAMVHLAGADAVVVGGPADSESIPSSRAKPAKVVRCRGRRIEPYAMSFALRHALSGRHQS
jgi:hypothetical protein